MRGFADRRRRLPGVCARLVRAVPRTRESRGSEQGRLRGSPCSGASRECRTASRLPLDTRARSVPRKLGALSPRIPVEALRREPPCRQWSSSVEAKHFPARRSALARGIDVRRRRAARGRNGPRTSNREASSWSPGAVTLGPASRVRPLGTNALERPHERTRTRTPLAPRGTPEPPGEGRGAGVGGAPGGRPGPRGAARHRRRDYSAGSGGS